MHFAYSATNLIPVCAWKISPLKTSSPSMPFQWKLFPSLWRAQFIIFQPTSWSSTRKRGFYLSWTPGCGRSCSKWWPCRWPCLLVRSSQPIQAARGVTLGYRAQSEGPSWPCWGLRDGRRGRRRGGWGPCPFSQSAKTLCTLSLLTQVVQSWPSWRKQSMEKAYSRDQLRPQSALHWFNHPFSHPPPLSLYYTLYYDLNVHMYVFSMLHFSSQGWDFLLVMRSQKCRRSPILSSRSSSENRFPTLVRFLIMFQHLDFYSANISRFSHNT